MTGVNDEIYYSIAIHTKMICHAVVFIQYLIEECLTPPEWDLNVSTNRCPPYLINVLVFSGCYHLAVEGVAG